MVIAGGVESMSLVPMLVGAEDADPWLAEHRPRPTTTMGITAENVARQWGISRADRTPWPLRATAGPPRPGTAVAFGRTDHPHHVPGPDGGEVVVWGRGHPPRHHCGDAGRAEALLPWKTARHRSHLLPMTDVPGFVVLASEEKPPELGVKPLARFVSFATGGVPGGGHGRRLHRGGAQGAQKGRLYPGADGHH